ncbi:hypothetical protein [Halomonas binhaiensis]|uniref:Uncharacterized protein n=1 Tax=Halomonas binhaiensis TaxID=2562282 RepID=A0A5C1NG54_9GAMM|nr:hypothetical protein [Halomonas binhaiensis]QEM82672.1 hypothetical protein E4T21_14790 [Halomonas binhaiensis]
MNIYYREERLCGSSSGNGSEGSWLDRLSMSRRSRAVRDLFPMAEINTVLYNRHNSIGCSVKAPLGNIMWRNEDLWYSLPCGAGAYIPRNISFTDGRRSFYLVVIGETCEARFWPHSALRERDEAEWFSHRPPTFSDIQAIKVSFDALVAHVCKEDELVGRCRL